MNNVKLLDCTLRDGGYVNDWEFGNDNLNCIFERLVSTNTDIIEVGFLDERRKYDKHRSIMPNTNCVEEIYGKIDKKNAVIVGMIDYGTCGLENITPCEESYLDGIRVIFKKHNMHEAVEFCREIKKLGYKVFVQAVSITSYSDEEFLKLIRLVNEIEAFALSVVDTYGLLHQNFLMHYIELMDYNLKDNIGMGYHSHNNFQLGYANCIEVIKYNTKRTVLVDGTLYGMGKSAGNTPLELLAMYLNGNCGTDYNISQMLEAIDCHIISLHSKYHWGYNMFYYTAASNDCHPSYVKYLMDKHTLSVNSINEILVQIDDARKLLYDQEYIESLYATYQKNILEDSEALQQLSKKLRNREILILGPGPNYKRQKSKIEGWMKGKDLTIISINFIPEDYITSYIFISNAKRYAQISTELKEQPDDLKTIATSNVTRTMGSFDYVLDYSMLLNQHEEFPDSSFVMLLKVFLKIGIKKVAVAGFDGYSLEEGKGNFYKSSMEHNLDKKIAASVNKQVEKILKKLSGTLEVEFITESVYKGVKGEKEKI